jgi:hypothetical protein
MDSAKRSIMCQYATVPISLLCSAWWLFVVTSTGTQKKGKRRLCAFHDAVRIRPEFSRYASSPCTRLHSPLLHHSYCMGYTFIFCGLHRCRIDLHCVLSRAYRCLQPGSQLLERSSFTNQISVPSPFASLVLCRGGR